MLLEEHRDKYLTISDQFEVRAFDSISEAYSYGAKTYGLGQFLLQKCSEDADKVQIISNMAHCFV